MCDSRAPRELLANVILNFDLSIHWIPHDIYEFHTEHSLPPLPPTSDAHRLAPFPPCTIHASQGFVDCALGENTIPTPMPMPEPSDSSRSRLPPPPPPPQYDARRTACANCLREIVVKSGKPMLILIQHTQYN